MFPVLQYINIFKQFVPSKLLLLDWSKWFFLVNAKVLNNVDILTVSWKYLAFWRRTFSTLWDVYILHEGNIIIYMGVSATSAFIVLPTRFLFWWISFEGINQNRLSHYRLIIKTCDKFKSLNDGHLNAIEYSYFPILFLYL